jgi:4-alpha-glucanotransferase
LGIKLFGDLPFYVSHDSADVWSHRDIFCLDRSGEMTGIAGVPPDYFSEDGQLWGMPTYNWKVLEQQQYNWWLQRLQRNMELYDLLRLDHFRAFAQYWEVPAGEDTAKNGRWIDGPGIAFFDFVRQHLGHLPFVAEDLGDHMDAVYRLRDEAKLPGMKVLQFAFGTHMAQSVDIPHNYIPGCIVYTGTHDNNTTTGWYQDEAGRADHKRLEKYAGTRVNAGNIHQVLARMAYASVAQTVIIPVQDTLALGRESRMNTPGTGGGNWRWRLAPGALNKKIQARLCTWAKMYNRL